jgi:peroxiredoxin
MRRVSLQGKIYQSSSLQTHKDKKENLSMPEVGDMAPDFELKSHLQKDKKVRLSDFRGKKNVVLAFYPLAWTPV